MKITDQQLKIQLPILAARERKATAELLEHIAEVDRRKLFLTWGYSSLFAYMTGELKFSEGSANRRIAAARELRKDPELKNSFQNGELNLSQIAIVHAGVRQEAKRTGVAVTATARKEIFKSIQQKNTFQTQKILDQLLPNFESKPAIAEKHKRDDSVELTLRIPKETFERLQEVRDFYSHIAPGANWIELLDLMSKDIVKLRDQKREVRSRKTPKNTVEFGHIPALTTQRLAATAVISSPIRRMVFQRDQGQCQHKFANGQKCLSRYQPEIDHIHPRFAGGGNEPENLRVLCRAHNQDRYRQGRGIIR